MSGPAPSLRVLLEEVAARAGPAAGEVPFAANLDLLLRSAAQTGRLNATGARVLHRAAVRHLRNLLALQAYTEGHPEVAGRSVAGALVVTGLPRTGTTLLHNLLAQDPDHRVLRFWEALQPLPPGAGGPPFDELVARAERWLAAFYELVPGFRAVHPATATGPEECDALLQNTFASQHFDDMFDAEEYSAWLARAGLADEYAHYALQLRVLAPGAGVPRWALKSPSHLGHLDALVAVLPGSTIVVCHRHPAEAVASYASLIGTLREAYGRDVSASRVGSQALERAATAMGRAMQFRESHARTAIVDVSYRRLAADPLAAVRDLYRHTGRDLAPGTEAAMAEWVRGHPAGRHGRHSYGLDRFGLTAGGVEDRFAAYLARYGELVGG